MSQAFPKNFNFDNKIRNWGGYVSSIDKTKVEPNLMVGGSQNVFKNIAGNLETRPGQKRRGDANSANSPISSEYVFTTSVGTTYTMVVADSNLYAVTADNVWYSLATGVTDTRYVFDKWWRSSTISSPNSRGTENKNYLVMVNGNDYIQSWAGGLTTVASTSDAGLSIVGNSASLTSPVSASGTAPFTYYPNTLVGTSFESALVFSSNPTNGQTLTLTINGNAQNIQFVSVIGATPGNVLIGANLAATLTNLRGLLAAGGTTNATQVALASGTLYVGLLTSTANVSTITKNGTGSWADSGFSSDLTGSFIGFGQVTIAGTVYTYTGGANTNTIYGVTPSPTGIAANEVAISTLQTNTNTPVAGFSNDFCKVIDNQLYTGSYQSQICYVSKSTSCFDYATASPSLQGSANIIVFDGLLKGITVRNGKPFIGIGTNKWGQITYTYTNPTGVSTTTYRTTTIDYTPVSTLAAPYAHEFIDVAGDNIIYLAQDQQVRTFGNFNNSFTSNNFPSLSQEIFTELQELNFTGGAIKCIGDFTYLTVPNSGRVYIYQVRQAVNAQGQTVNERLWYSPFIWNATRVDEINGVTVVFSNANPQIYEVWDTNQWYDDSPSDESLPYECIAALPYWSMDRSRLLNFDKIYTEGYITPGTTLSLAINYEYNGSTNTLTKFVNSIEYPATYYQTTVGSLGDESFGESSMGMGGDESGTQDDLVKFRTINSYQLSDVFEYQLTYSSDQINSRWEILTTGANQVKADYPDVGFLINKQ